MNQTYTDWELIAVNDHSNDNSSVILEDFASQDKRIRWVNNSGRGISYIISEDEGVRIAELHKNQAPLGGLITIIKA